MSKAAAKKQALGRGLSALLGPESFEEEVREPVKDGEEIVKSLKISEIRPGRYQPRKLFDKNELQDLSASIREMGILQPILVRTTTNGKYEIIAGERRWRAAQLAGKTTIPVIVKNFSNDRTFEAALIENMQRLDLSSLEEAEGMQQFMYKFGYTQEQLSKKLSKSRSYIANALRLLNLPAPIRDYLQGGKLSAGHARALLNAKNPEALAEEIVSESLSVRQTEELIKKSRPEKVSKVTAEKPVKDKDQEVTNLEQLLESILQIPVHIKLAGERAVMTLQFNSLEKLDTVVDKFSKLKFDMATEDRKT